MTERKSEALNRAVLEGSLDELGVQLQWAYHKIDVLKTQRRAIRVRLANLAKSGTLE